MFDMFGDNAPADPADFDDAAELARAVTLARESDVALVVLGEWQNMIGEAASRSSLELPGGQLTLLQAIVATGTPVVLLLMNGRPLDLRWAADSVPAILDIWYPGTQGGTAVADVIFGDVPPGGKLPFSWPRTAGQIPVIYSHTISHQPGDQGRRYWDEPEHPAVPVRARPVLQPVRVPRPDRRPRPDPPRPDRHRVGHRDQHGPAAWRRGRPPRN
jgi:beta-glucosidase